MGRRYYRRPNSDSAGALIRDSVEVGNRLPWWGAALPALDSIPRHRAGAGRRLLD